MPRSSSLYTTKEDTYGSHTRTPTALIELSEEERETLERWARRPKSAQALALRCRIVLAATVGLSQTAISKIWRAFGLKPHATEDFKLSPDPQFIDKARDVVGLYLNPPDAAVVLCVDEKTQVQALDRTAPGLR